MMAARCASKGPRAIARSTLASASGCHSNDDLSGMGELDLNRNINACLSL